MSLGQALTIAFITQWAAAAGAVLIVSFLRGATRVEPSHY